MVKSKADIKKLKRYIHEREILYKIWWIIEKFTWKIDNLNKKIDNLRIKIRLQISDIHDKYEK